MEDDIVLSCIRSVVVKTCRTAATLVEFAAKRILDFIGLIFNIAALCTVVRAYPLVHMLLYHRKDKDWRPWVWRGGGVLQLLIFIMDIPFAIMLFLETIFFWRLALLIKYHDSEDLNTKWYDSESFNYCGFIGFNFRVDIFISFLGLITDLFVIPFAFILFFSWRSVKVFMEMKNETSDFGRKRVLLINFFLLIVDIFVLIMFLVQCFSWRLTVMFHVTKKVIGEYTKENTNPINNDTQLKRVSKIEWNFRRRVFYNFLRLLLDILMIPMIILLIFSWRLPILCKKFNKFNLQINGPDPGPRWKAELQLRGGILAHFWRYCFDLVMLIPIAIMLCSWRHPILILKFNKFFKSARKRKDELKLRYSLLFHALQVLVDIITIPPMIITLFSWRFIFFIQIFPLNSNKSISKKFKKIRLQFWWEAAFFFLDIPVIIGIFLTVCFCWCFPWRLHQIFVAISDSRGSQRKSRYKQCDIRMAILVASSYVLCDLFVSIFCGIIILTGWRMPFLVNKILTIRKRNLSNKWRNRSFEYHTAVLKQFALLFIDLTMLIFLIVIFGTLWRIKPMARKIIKHAKYENPDQKEQNDSDEDGYEEQSSPQKLNDTDHDVHIEPEERSLCVEKANDNEAQSNDNDIKMAVLEKTEIVELNIALESKEEQLKPTFLGILFGVRGWKIRKAIVMNIVGLLLDIPSFIMLIINVAFIYQIPFILQRFLECGDFYQEFFFIMVDETNHLLQDIVFFFIFVFLNIVRPAHAWINILEDKDHFKDKKSREYLSIIQNIVKQRDSIKMNIESAFSVFVKYHQLYSSSHDSVTKRFIDEGNVYTDEIKKMRDRLLEEELNDNLVYLMANIYFYESKKPYLLTRKYKIEEMFCMKACLAARERNLTVWNEEKKIVDDKLDETYSKLENFEMKNTPLWSDKIGLLMRTRRQNQKVIINTMTSGYFGVIAIFILNCMFIYRIPVMIKNMLKVSYCRYRVRDAALNQTKEYLLDWLALLKVLIVIISIYRCPALICDIFHDIFSKRSLSAARKTVDKYPVSILNDLLDLLRLFFRWDTVIFCFAFVLFILLIPLSVVINTIRGSGWNIIIVFLMSLPIYSVVMAGPFLIVHKVASIGNSMNNGIIPYAIVGFLGFVLLISVAFVIMQTKAQTADKKYVKSIDYIRFNWFNAQLVFLEFLEVIQLLALLFSIRNLAVPYAKEIKTVSQYILLDVYGYMVRFGLSVGLFVIWVIICTVPSLLEGVTKKVPKGHFSNDHFAWRSFLSFFGITMFITLPEMTMSLLSCDYSNCTNESICPSLSEDTEIACWSGNHLVIASISFFMMVWYVLTAMLFCMQYTDVTNKKVDLQFSPPYSALVNLAKLSLVIGISLFNENKLPVLCFVSIVMVVLIIASFTFPLLTGMAVSNTKALLIWRIETFFVVLVFSLGTLAFEVIEMSSTYKEWSDDHLIFDETSLIEFIIPVIVLSVTILSMIIALILSKYCSKTSEQEMARSEFKKTIRNMIAPEVKEHKPQFIPHWKKVCKPYKRMLSVVRMADKNDKSFQEPLEQYVPLDDSPPPAYNSALLDLPPPPSYDALKGDTSATFLIDCPEAVEVDNVQVSNSLLPVVTNVVSEPTPDDFFLPNPAMYLEPVGPYEDFDASVLLQRITLRNPNPGGIFRTGWIMDETVPGAKEKQLTDTHCTGIDLLLLLEEHISYTSLSYEFVTSLPEWRDEVRRSTWMGLRDCALKLEDNLTSTYTKPKEIFKADETDLLVSCVDTSHLPPYFPLSDITDIKLKLHQQGVKRLMSYLPEPWLSIFGKIIPSADSSYPLIYKVTLGSEDDNNLYNIRVEMFTELEIVVKGVDPEGFKAAIGASIVLPNPIVIARLRKLKNSINFGEPYPYGKKGMLSKKITSCGTKVKNGVYSLIAAGRSVSMTKVLASLADLEWRFVD